MNVQGSKVETFEDLHVFQQARELTNRVYEITRSGSFSKDRSLVDQVRRASVSVMSNIAEGFERGTNAEFIHFLFIAKGSCGEVRAQLTIAFDQGYIDGPTCERMAEQCRRVSGMLGNFIGYLKTSKYKGTKHKKAPMKSMVEQLNEILQRSKAEP